MSYRNLERDPFLRAIQFLYIHQYYFHLLVYLHSKNWNLFMDWVNETWPVFGIRKNRYKLYAAVTKILFQIPIENSKPPIVQICWCYFFLLSSMRLVHPCVKVHTSSTPRVISPHAPSSLEIVSLNFFGGAWRLPELGGGGSCFPNSHSRTGSVLPRIFKNNAWSSRLILVKQEIVFKGQPHAWPISFSVHGSFDIWQNVQKLFSRINRPPRSLHSAYP